MELHAMDVLIAAASWASQPVASIGLLIGLTILAVLLDAAALRSYLLYRGLYSTLDSQTKKMAELNNELRERLREIRALEDSKTRLS